MWMFGIKLSQVDFTVCICECLVLNDLKYSVYMSLTLWDNLRLKFEPTALCYINDKLNLISIVEWYVYTLLTTGS